MVDTYDCKKRCTVLWGLSIISLCVSLQYTCPAYAMQRVLSYTTRTSLEFVQGAAKIAAKTIWQNPKLLVLILVVYYYKEIWDAIKDGAGFLFGEYPLASFSAGALALWCINEISKEKSAN